MKIRNKMLLFFAITISSLFLGCHKIESGYTGLKVSLLGTDKGAITEVPPGRYFNVSPNVEYLKYPTFVQIVKWTEDSTPGSREDEAIRFQSSEGMRIVADVGLDYRFNVGEGHVATVFKTYRKSPEEIANTIIKNRVRDALVMYGSEYSADDIISSGKNELMEKVFQHVKETFKPDIEITGVYWLAEPRPPQQVIDALNEKVRATQIALQRENEVKTAEAEAKKKVAEAEGQAQSILIVAKAEAEANKLKASSLNSLLVEQEKIKKWDGKLPTVTSNGNNIIDLR